MKMHPLMKIPLKVSIKSLIIININDNIEVVFLESSTENNNKSEEDSEDSSKTSEESTEGP